MVDFLEQLLDRILEITAIFVMPDWAGLIGLIPILLLIGVLGPILSLMVLAWVVYVFRRPRVKVAFAGGPRSAPTGEDGRPAYPAGEPYCARDTLIFPFGATRCETCGGDLAVVCPKCQIGRDAGRDTCGNCGLVLRIEPRLQALRPAGPPPGGAAAA